MLANAYNGHVLFLWRRSLSKNHTTGHGGHCQMRRLQLLIACTLTISATLFCGCMPEYSGEPATAVSTPKPSKAPDTDLPEETEPDRPKDTDTDDAGPIANTPKIIIDINDYNYQWGDLEGSHYVDTSGSATLVLDKNKDLYYFGIESPTPVVIMQNVKKFSINDDSDTLGYTAPIAVILTEDGDLYACGETDLGVISDVNVLGSLPENGPVSFLNPVLISTNVTDCHASWREIDYITKDNSVYRSKHKYQVLDIQIDNPTPADKVEDIDQLFVESQNFNFVLENTVQMGSARSFFISVLEDGSVWTCFLPENDEDTRYAEGYGEVMGDGSDILTPQEPVMIFPPGTCF